MSVFAVLTFPDVRLGLEDLLENRRGMALMPACGMAFVKLLEGRRGAVEALPIGLEASSPLSVELGAADVVHDSFARAIHYYTRSATESPGLLAESERAFLTRVRETFAPALADSLASHADETASRRSSLQAMGEDLSRFPVPGDKTLRDWVAGLVNAGERVAELLSRRADGVAAAVALGRREAAALRASCIGLLDRFRTTVADELLADPSLPRDLDARIFAHLDELVAARIAAVAEPEERGPGIGERREEHGRGGRHVDEG